MDKYIAFNLYRKNEQGGHTEALSQSKNTAGFAVYLASEVNALLREIATCPACGDNCAAHQSLMVRESGE